MSPFFAWVIAEDTARATLDMLTMVPEVWASAGRGGREIEVGS